MPSDRADGEAVAGAGRSTVEDPSHPEDPLRRRARFDGPRPSAHFRPGAPPPHGVRAAPDLHAPADASPGPGTRPAPAGRRFPRPRWRTLARPAAIYALSRLVTAIGLVVVAATTGKGPSQELYIWDGRWFIRAAVHGYPTSLPVHDGHVAGSTIAFLPAFPAAIRWLVALTPLTPLEAGVTISVLTGLTAVIGVWYLVREFAGPVGADRATLLVALFPGSFVFSLAYSEGIVITCVAFGLLALLRRRWWWAGVLGLVATATSPVALAFAVSCAVCAVRAVRRDRSWVALAAPVLAPLGFVGYMVWLRLHTGSLDAWRLTERGGWHSYPSLTYPWDIVTRVVTDPVAPTVTGWLLFGGTVLAVVGAVLAVRGRLPLPVLVYGLLAAGMAAVSAPVGLRPRFLLLAFPLLVAIGLRLRGRWYQVAVAASALLLCAFTVSSVGSLAVFP